MQLAIASGKGGTGKTTLATNLAWVAAGQGHDVLYLDCDVEEPNGHCFLPVEEWAEQQITQRVPHVSPEQCTLCGDCGAFCQFGALVCAGDRVMVFPDACHACGGCSLVCSTGALHEVPHRIGRLRIGVSGRLQFVEGTLDVGRQLVPPVIRAVKDAAKAAGEAGDRLQVIDAPPGTTCSMVEAVRHSDLVILVTEPTPFGAHDLQLAVETVGQLELPVGVVINRAGLADELIHDYCQRVHVPVLGELPNDRRVAHAYSCGLLACQAVAGYAARIEQILDQARALAGTSCMSGLS